MINVDWNTVEDTSFPTAGAYKAKIIGVKDEPAKEYLLVTFEIADGKFKGYAQKTFDEYGYYPYRMPWSYKRKALWFFKQRKIAIEATNRGYEFRNDPESLIGKFCAIILAEEEYRNQKNEIKKRLYVADVISGQQFNDGAYEIPELKKLTAQATSFPTAPSPAADYSILEDDDGDLPF